MYALYTFSFVHVDSSMLVYNLCNIILSVWYLY